MLEQTATKINHLVLKQVSGVLIIIIEGKSKESGDGPRKSNYINSSEIFSLRKD